MQISKQVLMSSDHEIIHFEIRGKETYLKKKSVGGTLASLFFLLLEGESASLNVRQRRYRYEKASVLHKRNSSKKSN